MKKKVILRKGFITSLALIIGISVTDPVLNSCPAIVKAEAEVNIAQATGINVAYHTEDEIRDYLRTSGATVDDPVIYKEEPNIKAPYKAGSLTDETLNSAIKMVNQIRYIAGISYNVSLRDEYVAKAQAASLVNRVNDELTHTPACPSDMEASLYQLGAQGAGSSNLSCGYSTINDSLVNGYMNDGSSSNIARVGHRRWILNPEMSATGFGYCNRYSAMYAFDRENTSAAEYGVVWPAQTMPTDYFGTDYPWSISMGYEVSKDNIQVKLVRMSDNRTWNFSSVSADGYFNVNNGGYGQKGCIIFRPEGIEDYVNGDQFQVTITGLNTPIAYYVSFFDLVLVTSVGIKENVTRLIKDEWLYLETTITPSDASNPSIKWSSSDTTIAEVSKFGEVTGKGYGKAAIRAINISSGLSAAYEITVVPASIEINDLASQKKGQVIVSYQKDKSVSGYEIVCATNSKFTKNKKIKAVSKASTSKVTVTGLKGGKEYYVKIRSYALVNGEKIYSDYGDSDTIWVRK